MDYSTTDSRGAMLFRQGVREIDLRETFDKDVVELVEQWMSLPEPEKPSTTLFHKDGLACFIIRRDGSSNEKWPDAAATDLSESFFREFAESDRVWETVHQEPRCFELSYKAHMEPGKLQQIICPVFEDGQPVAFVVVGRMRGSF